MSVKYTKCPVKIPKSGKKLKDIGGHRFFFRTKDGLIYVYEIETEILVLCTQSSKGEEWVIDFITRNMDRVERFKNG